MRDLIERLERAEAPSRELDAEIAEAEALVEHTGEKDDIAYNRAVEHIAQAIRSEANG